MELSGYEFFHTHSPEEEARQKERKFRYEYWNQLKKLREEFLAQESKPEWSAEEFVTWVEQAYGIVPNTQDGSFAGEYKITDEKKFLIFQLRYG